MIYHFIFGLADNFNKKPFCYFHFLNLKSCYLTQNKPTIYIHCIYEPINNEWWEKAKNFCKIIKYKLLPDIVYKINNKNVWRIEHQSDIFRLLILKEYGGVYADIDTFFYKPFFPKFKDQQCVLGIESIYYANDDTCLINGLCNALIIADKTSKFIDLWLDHYVEEYDSEDWNKMSVRKPYELYQLYPNLLTVESNCSFHKYNWNILFYSNTDYLDEMNRLTDYGIYSKHMAESKIYDILKDITPDKIKNNNSLFAKMCKNIPELL